MSSLLRLVWTEIHFRGKTTSNSVMINEQRYIAAHTFDQIMPPKAKSFTDCTTQKMNTIHLAFADLRKLS
jgi:hypothetical protein